MFSPPPALSSPSLSNGLIILFLSYIMLQCSTWIKFQILYVKVIPVTEKLRRPSSPNTTFPFFLSTSDSSSWIFFYIFICSKLGSFAHNRLHEPCYRHLMCCSTQITDSAALLCSSATPTPPLQGNTLVQLLTPETETSPFSALYHQRVLFLCQVSCSK